MAKGEVGTARRRDEDERHLRGRGRYAADVEAEGAARMFVLRSPHAAAGILSIDTSEAEAMPGVIAVLTGRDAAGDGLGTLRPLLRHQRPDGSDMVVPPHGVLALDRVRFVGDGVAVVVAETAAQAEDAAEAIIVDYEESQAVTDVAQATAPEAPAVWDEVPDNVAFLHELGDRGAAEDAFRAAGHVVELTMRISRVSANPIEPRNALGRYDPASGRYELVVGTQTPNLVRRHLAAEMLRVDPSLLRVVSPDCGGSFGMKNTPYPEYALVLWAAKRVGRAVRWVASRSESLLSDYHGRDNLTTAALALDHEGRFLGLRVRTLANLGAYLGVMAPHSPTANLGGLAGMYKIACFDVAVRGVHTHTQPTAPYRGAGRPEATYVIERLIDHAAARLGFDRVELRRRNMIRPEEMPYDTGLAFTYDCGDFPGILDRALDLSDWAGFEARRHEASRRGRLRGIGLSCPIEIAGGPLGRPLGELVDIRFDSGRAVVTLGSSDAGQGHGTAIRQIVAEATGLPAGEVVIVSGDTDTAREGVGTYGSRTTAAAGTAILDAVGNVVAKGIAIAAEELEAAAADIEFVDGAFVVAGTDRAVRLDELAARHPEALHARSVAAAQGPTFPNGCHVCEVEVDPETGVTELMSYLVVDDVGVAINPMLVKGQMHGGVAQGVGQALFEAVVYDPESGQLLSGSFTDYAMPRAVDLPEITVAMHPVPTRANPLGVKGAGEAGTVGSIPAVINAVVDALSPFGVTHIDMPATSEKVWRRIRAAGRG